MRSGLYVQQDVLQELALILLAHENPRDDCRIAGEDVWVRWEATGPQTILILIHRSHHDHDRHCVSDADDCARGCWAAKHVSLLQSWPEGPGRPAKCS